MKSKITLFIAALTMFVIGGPNANADCTLTTDEGTDGRCFNVDGQFKCEPREEDPNCFVGFEC